MKQFAETIGVAENGSYPRFKDKERLVLNVSACRYFVVRFVAKHIFNYKLSFSSLDEEGGQDWDIYWTDTGLQPERIAKMKPY